ncbi:hypothetical protein EDB92DRAFT_1804670, partial [Lactarius akahatsu]
DMNIKHLIQYLKTLFAAKGIYSNWDCLGNIAAGINYLQLMKKQVTNSLESGYQGFTHSDVDTSALVRPIAHKVNDLKLQSVNNDCQVNSTVHPVVNVFTAGYRNFQTLSLATFNKKIADMRQGKPSQPEVNEITMCQITEEGVEDKSDPQEELSALHKD